MTREFRTEFHEKNDIVLIAKNLYLFGYGIRPHVLRAHAIQYELFEKQTCATNVLYINCFFTRFSK